MLRQPQKQWNDQWQQTAKWGLLMGTMCFELWKVHRQYSFQDHICDSTMQSTAKLLLILSSIHACQVWQQSPRVRRSPKDKKLTSGFCCKACTSISAAGSSPSACSHFCLATLPTPAKPMKRVTWLPAPKSGLEYGGRA